MGGTTVWRVLCALILAGIVAACGGGGDDDAGDNAADGSTTTTAEAGPDATGTTLAGNAGVQRSDEAQKYVDAFTEASMSGAAVSQNVDQNRCFAETYVDTVGVDALAAVESPEDMTAAPGFKPGRPRHRHDPAAAGHLLLGAPALHRSQGLLRGHRGRRVELDPGPDGVRGRQPRRPTPSSASSSPATTATPAPVESDENFTAIIDG
jgi:hypothetical protein